MCSFSKFMVSYICNAYFLHVSSDFLLKWQHINNLHRNTSLLHPYFQHVSSDFKLKWQHIHNLHRDTSLLHPYFLQVSSDFLLNYSISLLANICKCTVQLTEHSGRELSSPLVLPFSVVIYIYIYIYMYRVSQKKGE